MHVVSRTETPALVAEEVATTLRLDARGRSPGEAAPDRQPGSPSRDALERELDRVQLALQAGETSVGQQITWLLLAQALFLNAYLLILVFGTGPAIPGKRWLLAGIAIFSAAFAVFTYLALRGSRDALRALRATRRDIEAALAKLGRTPVFAPRNFVTAGLASFASSLLPASFIAGWVAISVYALAVPNGPRPAEEPATGSIEKPATVTARPAAALPSAQRPAPPSASPFILLEPATTGPATPRPATAGPVPRESWQGEEPNRSNGLR